MANVLDPDGKGYLDFKDFSKKFGPTMSRQIEVADQRKNLPNLVPSKDKLVEFGLRSKSLRENVERVRVSFLPDPDASKYLKIFTQFLELVPATRFGAKPPHKNTFGHYH